MNSRNIVDGIAMAIHLTRRDGRRFVDVAMRQGVMTRGRSDLPSRRSHFHRRWISVGYYYNQSI